VEQDPATEGPHGTQQRLSAQEEGGELPLNLQYHYYVTTTTDQQDETIWSSLKDSYADEFEEGEEEDPDPSQPRWCYRSAINSNTTRNTCSVGGNFPNDSSSGYEDAGDDGKNHRTMADDVEAAAKGASRSGESRHSDNAAKGKIGDGDSDDHVDGGTVTGAPDSDYRRYHAKVNPEQHDRAVDIPLYSFARPHMRAFHLSWMAFLVAFFVWFSISPLLSEIASTLHLSHQEIWTSSCLAVASSAVTRVLIGPFNDKYGARWVMAVTLVAAAIPTALAGLLVYSSASLSLVRFFIGMAGSAFVTSQYWTSSIFCVEIAGTANALVAGWGNLGGCFGTRSLLPPREEIARLYSGSRSLRFNLRLFCSSAQVVVGSVLFPLFKLMYGGTGYSYNADLTRFDDGGYTDRHHDTSSDNATLENEQVEANARASELAWRTVLVIPAVMALVMAWVVIRFGDDTPKGNVWKRRRERPPVSWSENLWLGMRNRNTCVLFAQYACCFGCEITLLNAVALYFKAEYGQSTESAAAIASAFGWTNLFARGVGGFCSDMANAKSGMRGRLWTQSAFLVMEGGLTMAFAATRTLAGSIVTMVVFSVFLQAAKGSTFGIVPYVLPGQTGAVAGWVGAGGNVGGVMFSLLFRTFDYHTSFLAMGAIVLASSLFTIFISIPGHRGLFSGQDSPVVYEHRRLAKLPEAIAFTRPGTAACPLAHEGAPYSNSVVPISSAAASLVLSSGSCEAKVPAIKSKPLNDE
jgi:NNP family nitrate/nitrite transporter-like MFS transporter